ncbi:unnamed protein product [Staurois parvus]|uniref:Uncharacterized protein n=1 Tax=Staurois parvus TaxID=386267 RepID=A0ABN9BLX2_9NEOB|nr:unnamed protein product [Staurois parvus]
MDRAIRLDSGHQIIKLDRVIRLGRIIKPDRVIRLGRNIRPGGVHWVIGHQGIRQNCRCRGTRLNHGRWVLRRQADQFGYWQDGTGWKKFSPFPVLVTGAL